MRQTVLESDAKKLLRPYIDPVSFHINIRRQLLYCFRRVFTQNRRLSKYPPNILFNGFFIGREKRCCRYTLFIAVGIR
jgi:hypothetical protein